MLVNDSGGVASVLAGVFSSGEAAAMPSFFAGKTGWAGVTLLLKADMAVMAMSLWDDRVTRQ
jgi:hypothetical protein